MAGTPGINRLLTLRQPSPALAVVAGAATVGAVAIGVALLPSSLRHATSALLLVVPVIATAVLGGRRPAFAVAVLATLAFDLVLPPVGSLQVRFEDDAIALVVFFLVAVTVGALVAGRVETLGRLERQRAALLRSVSHDLRTPLATISGAASELGADSMQSPEVKGRLAGLVKAEAARLDRLVANLLSLARIESGALEPRRQAVDLGELGAECVRRLVDMRPGTALRIEVDEDLPSVFADYTLLDQVVTNLLENAIRHSPEGEPVDLTVERNGNLARLTVSDAGAGVPASQATAIFEPFHGTTDGSGIGLAICKAVVDAHGGTIALRESPRGGAAFTIDLPLSSSHRPAHRG